MGDEAAGGADEGRSATEAAGDLSKQQVQFLAALAHSADVGRAARAADLAEASVHKMRRLEPAFAAAWERALGKAFARLEELMLARALATFGGDGEAAETPGTPALSERGLLTLLSQRRAATRQERREPAPADDGADLRAKLEATLAEMHERLAAARG